MIAENDLDENWSLWLNLRTQHPTLRDPYRITRVIIRNTSLSAYKTLSTAILRIVLQSTYTIGSLGTSMYGNRMSYYIRS